MSPAGKGALPAVALTLKELASQLQGAYGLTTQGKFLEATGKFRQILLSIPLLMLDSKQEIQEVCAMHSALHLFVISYAPAPDELGCYSAISTQFYLFVLFCTC